MLLAVDYARFCFETVSGFLGFRDLGWHDLRLLWDHAGRAGWPLNSKNTNPSISLGVRFQGLGLMSAFLCPPATQCCVRVGSINSAHKFENKFLDPESKNERFLFLPKP